MPTIVVSTPTPCACCGEPPPPPPDCPPGVNCKVGPPPTGPDYGVAPCNECCEGVQFSVSFTSRNGTGCLCGFSEYIPTSPPKKYRLRSLNGTISLGGPGPCSLVGPYSLTVSGSASFDVGTRALTAAGVWNITGACTNCTNGTAPGIYSGQTDIPHWADFTAGAATIIETATTSRVQSGSCWVGAITGELSLEDKPADALARAAATTGTSPTAFLADFNASSFCFSGQSSTWSVTVTGAQSACDYRVTVIFTREPEIAGGASETIIDRIDFNGDGTISGEVPAVVGRETTCVGVFVSVTP
jgi:hypothetical protein